uniref:Metallophos_C domain-containing protein n=1 Tax=Rhabditophanes sp. KR3021 TaxID=114890 RepID=A0AC35TUP6_9BILA
MLLGHLDDFKDKLGRRTKWGCGDLLNAVEQRIKPKAHVYGYVHENHGLSTNSQTIFINASICNHDLKTVNMPIVFDYSLKEKRIKRNDEYE